MKKITILVVCILCSFFIFNFLFGKEMILEAHGTVILVREIEDRFTPSSQNIVGILEEGQKAKIIGCSNLKDDQVYKVEIAPGKFGYTTGVKFKITSKSSRDPLKGGVVCW